MPAALLAPPPPSAPAALLASAELLAPAALPAPAASPSFARVEAASFVLSLRAKGVVDLAVLRAMERVPREHFAPRRYADLARQDVALPLPFGQTMSAPTTVATMLAALALTPGQRVLEIGTGSGYITALLLAMGASVRSAERHPVLADSAATRLASMGHAESVELLCGDALADGADQGRYDRVLVNGAVPDTPTALLPRIGAAGRLVCGLSSAGQVRLLTIARDGAGQLDQVLAGPVRLSPMTSGVPAEI